MKITLPIQFVLILITLRTYSQTEYKKHIQKVLSLSITDSTFIFNTSKNRDTTITSKIRYLGTTNYGDKVLYIKESYPAAVTRHGFMMLYIIDSKGKKYFYHDIDEPSEMKNGVLIFKHRDKSGKSYFFSFDLNKEIPKFLCVEKDDCYDYQIDE